MQFESFDADYIERLCAGDPQTEKHFVGYFSQLLTLKLRSRLKSPQIVEDVRQETFARVLNVLRKDGSLRQPERLGAFVISVCNNVLKEQFRNLSRVESLDDGVRPDPPDTRIDVLDAVAQKEIQKKVREILAKMERRDRELLSAVWLEERDRDDVCRVFRVDREYLRVLLYRAKQEFKVEYMKHVGWGPEDEKK